MCIRARVTIGTYLLAYKTELGTYATAGVVFIGALLAYLWLNACLLYTSRCV